MNSSIHPIQLSALSLAKSNMCKSSLLSIVTNEWELTDRHMDELSLSHYFIKIWEGSHLRSSLQDGTLHDIESNVSYAVIYRGCTPAIAFKSYRVIISFRATNVGCFALVQPYNIDSKGAI